MRILRPCLMTVIVLAISACTASEDQGVDRWFFNLYDLDGWDGDRAYWSVEQKQVVGRATTKLTRSELLFSNVGVSDFYLSMWIRQTPSGRGGGVHFRSIRDSNDGAIGLQALFGEGNWGRLYEEGGRGRLDWTDDGEKHARSNAWNFHEILAVDQRIWTAVNGHLAAALSDPRGARTGYIALYLRAGEPQEIRFRNLKLVHNPAVELVGLDENQLNAALRTLPVDD